MKTDLKSMTRKELEKLKANVEKALARVEKKEMKEALTAAEKAAKAHGFSLAEITAGDAPVAKATRKAPKKPKSPAFQNTPILMTRPRPGPAKGVGLTGLLLLWPVARHQTIWRFEHSHFARPNEPSGILPRLAFASFCG